MTRICHLAGPEGTSTCVAAGSGDQWSSVCPSECQKPLLRKGGAMLPSAAEKVLLPHNALRRHRLTWRSGTKWDGDSIRCRHLQMLRCSVAVFSTRQPFGFSLNPPHSNRVNKVILLLFALLWSRRRRASITERGSWSSADRSRSLEEHQVESVGR